MPFFFSFSLYFIKIVVKTLGSVGLVDNKKNIIFAILHIYMIEWDEIDDISKYG